jgi:hypothetical protein
MEYSVAHHDGTVDEMAKKRGARYIKWHKQS